jgi:hypothetical protein
VLSVIEENAALKQEILSLKNRLHNDGKWMLWGGESLKWWKINLFFLAGMDGKNNKKKIASGVERVEKR